MIIWFFISISLALAYVYLIYNIFDQWQEQTTWLVPDGFIGQTAVSVIVAARNESENIEKLLASFAICAQQYPNELLEFIIVNDHSDDQTASIVNAFAHPQIKLINLSKQSGKKAAIARGIESATGSLILTTDADCIVPANWVKLFVSYFESHEVDFMAAPVIFSAVPGLLQRLQLLDLSGMMCVTQAGIRSKKWYMANGANMAFSKQAYQDIQGYENNKQWASGDDVFLIQNIASQDPSKVDFIKTSDAVIADPEMTFGDFVRQRIRWGTKNKSYQHNGILKTLGLVFLFSVCICLNLLLAPVFGSFLIFICLFQILIKWIIDYLFLNQMTNFFKQEKAMKRYILVAPMYLVYLVGTGLASLFIKNYTWKGRKVS